MGRVDTDQDPLPNTLLTAITVASMRNPSATAAMPAITQDRAAHTTPEAAPLVTRAYGLRTYLLALMLAAALPVLFASMYTVWHVANTYRDSSTHRLLDTAENLGHTIEADMANRARMLQAFAAEADTADVWQLDKWLTLTGLTQDSVLIVLPKDGQSQLVSGRPLHTRYIPKGLLDEAMRTNVPVFSQLYFHGDQPRVAMAVRTSPTSDNVLVLATTPQQLISAAQDNDHQQGVLIAVTDGTGRIVARSVQGDRFVGTPVPDWQKLKALNSPAGTFEAKRADNGSVIFAFHSLAGTPGWVVVAGEALEAFDARWQKPMRTIVVVGIAALIVTLLLSLWLARQLLQPIYRITESARSGASYSDADDAKELLRVQEFEVLQHSLSSARSQLESSLAQQRQIANALSISERRSRTLAHAGASVLWTLDSKARATSMVGWQAIAGTPDHKALGYHWLRRVHRDDISDLRRQVDNLLNKDNTLDVELRLRTTDGQWRWMRARGAAILDNQQHVHEWLGVLEDVDDRKRAQAAVAYLAHHDPLTGLPNRSLLQDHMVTHAVNAEDTSYSVALLYLYLDRFKQVNDTMGHAAGDTLLCSVAERLRGLLRDTDLVVRLGGDEFCIVQKASTPKAAASLAQRVIDVLSADYFIDGQRVNIGVSVGITLHIGQAEAMDSDRLLREADIALYEAKNQGRGRFVFYTADLHA